MNQNLKLHYAPQSPLSASRINQGSETFSDSAGHIRGIEASSSGLVRSTLLAATAAAGLLMVFYLPAEYGVDPTGLGSVLGLTEMGEIKQQLYAEAEADAAGTGPAAMAAQIMNRLDRNEAQLAGQSGAPVPAEPTPASPASEVVATVPAPRPEAAPEAVAEAPPAAPVWRDTWSFTLQPGEGIEAKLAMQEGEQAQFEWTANGAVLNYDQHGDGSGQKISYEQGRGEPGQSGILTAAFTGNHGWFWRNRTDEPVTFTLNVGGSYERLLTP